MDFNRLAAIQQKSGPLAFVTRPLRHALLRLISPYLLELSAEAATATATASERSAQAQQDVASALAGLVQHHAALQQAFVDHTDQTDAIRLEIAALHQSLIAQQEENSLLRQGLIGQQQEIAALRQGLAGQQEEIAALRQGLTGQQEEIAALRQGLTGHNAEIALIRQGLAGHQEEIALIRHGVIGQADEAATLYRGLAGQQEEISLLRGSLSGLQEEINHKPDASVFQVMLDISNTKINQDLMNIKSEIFHKIAEEKRNREIFNLDVSDVKSLRNRLAVLEDRVSISYHGPDQA